MKKAKVILFLFVCQIIISCSNDSEKDLILPLQPIPVVVKYSIDVKSIIDNNCISCHGTVPTNGAPMSLVTSNDVKGAILSRGLLNRISLSESAPGFMPLGGSKLSQNAINIISKWQNDGFIE